MSDQKFKTAMKSAKTYGDMDRVISEALEPAEGRELLAALETCRRYGCLTMRDEALIPALRYAFN
jgi:hypothetical protein